MGIKLGHGLKDGKVVRVTDIDVANGLACNCICLDCKSSLQAIKKEGNKYRPHFRHHSIKNDREILACKASEETAIHFHAKDIIEKLKSIVLPAYEVNVIKHNGKGIRTHTIKKQRFITFDSIHNENVTNTSQGHGDIKPDLIAYFGNHRLFIEIAVSHPSEKEKIESLKKHNVSAIEIDLSKFSRTATADDLEKYFTQRLYLKEKSVKWLYHVKHEQYHQEALNMEQEKAKRAAILAKKEEAREIELQKKRNEIFRSKFSNEINDLVLNQHFKGDLFQRIEQFVKSKYRNSINFYSRKDSIFIEHKIDGLESVLIYAVGNGYQVECDFLELDIFASIQYQTTNKEFGYFVIAKIFYEASRKLCNGLEELVLQNESIRLLEEEKKQKIHQAFLEKQAQEFKALQEMQAKELEEQRRQEALAQEIAEESRRNIEEQRRKENEKRKIDEEKIVYKTIMEILQNMKKRETWKNDHPVMPNIVIKQVREEIAGFNDARFIDVRRRLQNKGQLNKVNENVLLTAVIVK
ncbi:hypothetical protein JCM14076_16660 [Methylosoma difficile]